MDSLEREARERKKRMIALATLPLSVGFFVWRLQANSSAAPEPPRPPESIVKKAAPEVMRVAGPVLQMEKQKIVVASLGSRDPFSPAFATNPQAATKVALAPPKTVVRELMGPQMRMPALSLPPLKPFEMARPIPAMGTQGVIPPVRPVILPVPADSETARPAMPYVLTGIVKGSPDVAILRHWDGSRRIARVGDALDPKYRLTLIEESFVVVGGEGDALTLRLGGDVDTTAKPGANK